MLSTQADRDAQNRLYDVTLPPAVERRHLLTSFADSAILKASMLYSRENPREVAQVKAAAAEMRATVARYGEAGADTSVMVAAAERVRAAMAELAAVAPIMGRDYYAAPILDAADRAIAELGKPLPTAKAAKP